MFAPTACKRRHHWCLSVCFCCLAWPCLQGIFVGALLSMSSTSVVVKCLESYRMNATAFGQITIGTLILQVGGRWVGASWQGSSSTGTAWAEFYQLHAWLH